MSDIYRVESIKEVTDYMGIPKPKHPLISIFRFKDIPPGVEYGDQRFLLDLYQITFKGASAGSIGYGRNRYDFEEGTVLFTKPGQIVQFSGEHDPCKDTDGWSLLFHPDLIISSSLEHSIKSYSFFNYESNEALHLSDEERSHLNSLMNRIEFEYDQSIDGHSHRLITGNVELILEYCARYYDRQFHTRTNLHKGIAEKFRDMLTSYFDRNEQLENGIPTVEYCGEALNLSPNYLSDLLKKETGISALDHIHREIIERAKSELLNTDNPISSIAYSMGFEYPQHFSKLFKLKTKLSPKEFRLTPIN